MATIKPFIRTSTKENKLVNVRFRLTDGRDVQLFHKSEIKVIPKDFDAKNEKIKAKIVFDAKLRKSIDDSISDRKKLISKLYLIAPDKSVLTSDWLEDAIDRELNPEKYINEEPPKPTEQTLLAHVADFISKAPEKKLKKTNTVIAQSTINSYIANQNRLIAFLKYKKRENLLLSEINEKFYHEYIDFLTQKTRTVKRIRGIEVNELRQYTNNTIGDAVKALKTMISDVKGLNIEIKNWYVLTEEVDNIYLDESELQRIKEIDLKNSPHLDRVRDWFLLLSWTGCRFSDLTKISKTDIRDGYITFRQQKTNTKVTIPLHPVVMEILEKYDYNMPDVISNQKFNDYIKDVAKIAEINDSEVMTKTIGGVLTSTEIPKYELISSHTGRRSFCTNMYKRGLPTLMIMSISGHKTEKSFLKYIKVKQEEHAAMMKKEWERMYK